MKRKKWKLLALALSTISIVGLLGLNLTKADEIHINKPLETNGNTKTEIMVNKPTNPSEEIIISNDSSSSDNEVRVGGLTLPEYGNLVYFL